jgi:hypothetical protein
MVGEQRENLFQKLTTIEGGKVFNFDPLWKE